MKQLCLFLLFSFSLAAEEPHLFRGKHFIASYEGCDVEALTQVHQLKQVMESAVRASGAYILDASAYEFPGNALTMVFLLSESHASIHTYPEYQACFVDLFTCGDRCNYEPFHDTLSSYLKPQRVSSKVFIRHREIESLSPPGHCVY
jgi:S-adenosylmethionine decarboxylase proenzyme